MSIDCVISERPKDTPSVKHEHAGADLSRFSYPSQYSSPIEDKSQYDLWPPGYLFHEGIDGEGKKRDHAEEDRKLVEAKENYKSGEKQEDQAEPRLHQY